MPSILGRILTNSFDPSVALGDTLGWFLQLLASQVVTNELGEIIAFHNSCGTFLSPALLSHGSLRTSAPLTWKKIRVHSLLFFQEAHKKKKDQNNPRLCLYFSPLSPKSLPNILFLVLGFVLFFYLFLRKKLKVLTMFITSIFQC